ncbi:hypothetical protein CP989_25955, partial [Enterobacter hormaechei]
MRVEGVGLRFGTTFGPDGGQARRGFSPVQVGSKTKVVRVEGVGLRFGTTFGPDGGQARRGFSPVQVGS